MLKTCRKYLEWVQYSVFEGEITKAKFMKLKDEMKKLVKEDDGDSVVIYKFRTMKYSSREVIGCDKNKDDQFI